MYTVKLFNDYCHGPIWVYGEDGIPCRYAFVEDDIYLEELNEEGRKLYDSFYSFNTPNAACEFSYEKEKANKDKMLSIIQKILKRLNEINDGSFVIEDYETKHLENLK